MKPQIIAHRGWSGRYPENTLISFEKALELPVDGIEFDLRMTADRKIVISYNFNVDLRSIFPVFKGISILFSIVAELVCTPTNSGRGFPFLHTLSRIYIFNCLYFAFIHMVSACSAAQSRPTLCDPMDCSLPRFSVHGICQARMLEWAAISSSKGSSQARGQTCFSWVSCIGRRIL